MISNDKKILFRLFILVAICALVNCYDSDALKFLKRGIILRCQGNPVSCYGKRSSGAELVQQPAQIEIGDQETVEQEKNENNYEKYLEDLIKSCKMGVDQSCGRMLKIMLMNQSK